MKARASEVFVGRTGELGELERVLEAARAGTGETVLVAGEAGIGKTRLASEVARRARGAGFEVFAGRSIDLVGAELPYLPFAEAFRPLGEPWRAARRAAGSQLGVFEATLALLTGRAAAAPVLLVLEDLHWADTSRSISSSSSRTTFTSGRFCCSRPAGQTSPHRPRACEGWRRGSGAPARRSCLSSVRSAGTS
jgi:predicted ATPase